MRTGAPIGENLDSEARTVFKMDRSPSDLVSGCGGDVYNVFNRLNSRCTKLELALCVFRPGDAALEHRHLWTEEMYIVISGEGLIRLDGAETAIGPGDAAAIPEGTWHQVVNDSSEDLVFWSVNSCPYDESDIHHR